MARWLPFALIIGIYALEAPVDLMDVDSAELAHISQQMLATKSFLVVKNGPWDYLDKPPLSFWLAAASFAAFGVSNAAYKLPSILFALLAIYSTFRLARIRDGDRVAWTAALMLASSAAMFLWTDDVRTDTILTGSVAFTLWQLAELRRSPGWKHLVGASIGVGLAMLAKGPIGLVVPVLAFAGEAALTRDWRWLISPRWLVLAAIVLLMLAPMLWGLYEQFGARGIRFYFWTQSFGRITCESTWHDRTTPLFFTHTILWELLPWTLFFVVGFFCEALGLVRARFRAGPQDDALVLSGFALPLVALSLSHYKLPHYIFPLIPLACIIAARRACQAAPRALLPIQIVILAALWFVTFWLAVVVFPLRSPLVWLALCLCLLVAVRFLFTTQRWILPSIATALGFALMMATVFYPRLLTYQASTVAARRLRQKGVSPDDVVALHVTAYSLQFLLQRTVPFFDHASDIHGDRWVFTDSAGREEIEAAHIDVDESVALPDYPVTRLTLPFLRPETRATRLNWRWLIHVRHA